MNKIIYSWLLLGIIFIGVGCSGTLPLTPYVAQNHVRASGEAAIGDFLYQPFIDGKVLAGNHIKNTAAGDLYAGLEIADLARRGTALELEKSGFILNENARYQVCGNVLELLVDDLGYSVDWTYSIRYAIVDRQSKNIVFEDTFTPPRKTTGKFSDAIAYASVLNNFVGQGYEMFIQTPGVKELLSQTTR